MSAVDIDVAVAVMTAYSAEGADGSDESGARARHVSGGASRDEVIDSFISLDVTLLAWLQGKGGGDSRETLRKVRNLSKSPLDGPAEIGVTVAAAYLSVAGDHQQAMARARLAAAAYEPGDAVESLIDLAVTLLALIQAEHGATGQQTLNSVSRMVETMNGWSEQPVLSVRGPRSLSRFVADLYKDRHR